MRDYYTTPPAIKPRLFRFDITGPWEREVVRANFQLRGIVRVKVTGGMGSFWHVYSLDGREFTLADDGEDYATSAYESLLEQIRVDFFAKYTTSEVYDWHWR